MLKTYLHGALVLLLFTEFACQNATTPISKTDEVDSTDQYQPISVDTIEPVFLRILQATSNGFGHDPTLILNNGNIGWQPGDGLGPDEGISIEFLAYQRVFISSIWIMEAEPRQIKKTKNIR